MTKASATKRWQAAYELEAGVSEASRWGGDVLELKQRHLILAIAGSAGLFLLLIVLAAGLHKEVIGDVQDLLGYGGPHSDGASGSRDLFHSGVPIGGVKAGETYGA